MHLRKVEEYKAARKSAPMCLLRTTFTSRAAIFLLVGTLAGYSVASRSAYFCVIFDSNLTAQMRLLFLQVEVLTI